MKSLFDQALYFLSQRDHSEYELRQKLSARFPEALSEIEATIEKLKSLGYLNNDRFLTHRIETRLKKGYGANRIISELVFQHHFDRETIEARLQKAQESEEYSVLLSLIRKRFASSSLPIEKQKVIHYCLQRGFRFEEIKEALSQFLMGASKNG